MPEPKRKKVLELGSEFWIKRGDQIIGPFYPTDIQLSFEEIYPEYGWAARTTPPMVLELEARGGAMKMIKASKRKRA